MNHFDGKRGVCLSIGGRRSFSGCLACIHKGKGRGDHGCPAAVVSGAVDDVVARSGEIYCSVSGRMRVEVRWL